MATAAVHGKNGKVTIGTEVAEVSNWSGTFLTAQSDTPSFSSSGWMDHVDGLKSFEVSFESYVFLNKQGDQASAIFQTNTSVASNTPSFSCRIAIENMGVATPVDDKIVWTYDCKSKGPVSINVS